MRETVKLNLYACANRISHLPEELLSRFLIFHLPAYTEEEFKKIVVHVLTKREKTPLELAQHIAEELSKTTRDPRDAIKIARLCKNKTEVNNLIQTLQKYSKAAKRSKR